MGLLGFFDAGIYPATIQPSYDRTASDVAELMELSSILFLVLVFVAFILMIFFVVKGFSSLGVVHSILMVLLFLFSLTFMFLSAIVHQRRVDEVHRFDRLEKQNKLLLAQQTQIKFGDLTAPKADNSTLLPLLSELGRLNLARGRAWRGASAQSYANGLATISLAPAAPPVNIPAGAPTVPGLAAVAPDSLSPELVVYAFGEGPSIDGRIVPQFYLGEFFVAESQGGTAKLRPTISLTPSQEQALQNNQFPRWSIYELMPLDSHVAFAEPDSKPSESEIYGRMAPETISRLLNMPLSVLEKSPAEMTAEEAYNASVLQSYLLDGQRAPEGTLPEAIWLRIKFVQEHTVAVDSEEVRNALEGGYFDISGRTVDARLKRGKDQSSIQFKAGSQIVYAREPAEDLIKAGVAQLIEPIYVRPLNDYAYLFKQTQLRINKATQDIELTQREIARTTQTESVGREQIVAKQAERKMLNEDLTQLENELAVVKSESESLDQQVSTVKAELSALFQRSQELYRRLVRTQQAFASGVN